MRSASASEPTAFVPAGAMKLLIGWRSLRAMQLVMVSAVFCVSFILVLKTPLPKTCRPMDLLPLPFTGHFSHVSCGIQLADDLLD